MNRPADGAVGGGRRDGSSGEVWPAAKVLDTQQCFLPQTPAPCYQSLTSELKESEAAAGTRWQLAGSSGTGHGRRGRAAQDSTARTWHGEARVADEQLDGPRLGLGLFKGTLELQAGGRRQQRWLMCAGQRQQHSGRRMANAQARQLMINAHSPRLHAEGQHPPWRRRRCRRTGPAARAAPHHRRAPPHAAGRAPRPGQAASGPPQ